MTSNFDRLRAYYRFKDRFPIGSAILPWVRKKLKKTVKRGSVSELVRTEDNLLIPVSSDEPATSLVHVRGSIDPSMEWAIRRYVRRGTVAVDVGANLGLLALIMADQVGGEGRVYAVEPNVNLYPYAERLFHLNMVGNVSLIDCACSDREGSVKMDLDEADHTKSRIADGGGCEVSTLPLDTILAEEEKSVSFVKIDVEGHEPKVLAGARGTLEVGRPALVFETGFHSQADVDAIGAVLDEVEYDVIGVLHDWGVEERALSTDMTTRTHCNVLALPRKR